MATLTPQGQDTWAKVFEQKRSYIINTLLKQGVPYQDCDDYLSSAFLKVMDRSCSFPLPDNPVAYLITAALNEFRNNLRTRKRHVLIRESLMENTPTPEETVEARLVIRRAFKILSCPINREVVFGHYFLGRTGVEQAAILGMKHAGVRVRRVRALNKLRVRLKIAKKEP